jgi:hypothetical protein
MQLNKTFNIFIAKKCFYIDCLNIYMFRPLYRPSSGCTLSYYKANYTIYNVFVFVKSCIVVHSCLLTAFDFEEILYVFLKHRNVYQVFETQKRVSGL